ncbi:hypothetical protein [Streptomyces sp. NPDC047046]
MIFTGTPAGTGFAREPRMLLRPGDTLARASRASAR